MRQQTELGFDSKAAEQDAGSKSSQPEAGVLGARLFRLKDIRPSEKWGTQNEIDFFRKLRLH